MEKIKIYKKNLNKSNKKKNSIVFYVKTSKKNYVTNISASLILSTILSYFSYLRGWHRPWVFLIFLFFFYVVYRMGEFVLTGKSLTYNPLFNRVDEGKTAFFYFIFNFLMFMLFIFGFLIFKPI